jgi:AcrR family transcriptional regulator
MAGRRGSDGKQRLLNAAFELFAERGFDRTTTRDIAARAGVALGLIHKHFGTIDELVKATDQKYLAWANRRLAHGLTFLRTGTTLDIAATAEDNLAIAYLKMALMSSRGGSQSLYAAVLRLCSSALRVLRNEGKLRTDVSIKTCALFVVMVELGALAVMPLHLSPGPKGSTRRSQQLRMNDVMSLVRDALVGHTGSVVPRSQ